MRNRLTFRLSKSFRLPEKCITYGNKLKMITLYGIPNCGSVKKARQLLSDKKIDYAFVDFKKTPPTKEQIALWIETLGSDVLINKKGTKWRSLSDEEKQRADTDAISLIVTYPTLIKRPLIEWEDRKITVGFDENFFR